MIALSTYQRLTALIAISVLVVSCANRGSGPQGGPKDEVPPVMLECAPQERATNVDRLLKKGIKMEFNENMAIKDAYKNVIISPPSKNKPIVKAQNKSVITTFDDTLKENTTYTIYYGDAITDNNEGNPIRNYTYVFSTGSEIDTLYIEGYIIDAHTLAPAVDIIAGIYPDAVDTTFTTTPFYRVAKTDTTGYFRIQNIPDKEYTLFALNDAGGDWYYSQKAGGTVAFHGEKIHPEKGEITDSTNHRITESPNHHILRLFTEKKTNQYFKKAMHPNREMFILVFGSEPSMLPKLRVLNSDTITESPNHRITESPFIMETPSQNRRDSLIYWVTDTTLLKSDTLRLEMTYLLTDSLEQLVEQTDTLNLRVTTKRIQANTSKKKKKGEEEPKKKKIEFINLTHNIQDKMEAPDTITINFAEPIKSILFDSISMKIKVDTLFNPIPVTFETRDSACNKELRIIYEKQFGETYRLDIDSAAIVSIYGKHNDKFYKTFTLKRLEEYSNLYIKFKENPEDAILELMNEKEEVKYRSVLEDGEVTFQDITPGDYYVRMIIDSNHNGEWDTGNVREHLQPEEVFYMNQKLTLPANWDVEQEWDYKSFHILNQRPTELKRKNTSR
ncbi:MAG: Ig-like domain-containing protein [Paludibacteraceae bacterium]|nr:Ig-like domain-containing protein [Paludibacteraceae bacterium]